MLHKHGRRAVQLPGCPGRHRNPSARRTTSGSKTARSPQHRLRATHQGTLQRLALSGKIRFIRRAPSSYTATCAAGELPSGHRRTSYDGSELLERHPKHVVQHESDTFGRGKFFQNHQHRQADGFRKERLILRIALPLVRYGREGGVLFE